MFSLIIPPISDCFMPTLGAAQIVGYLKERNIPCTLYDLSIDFIKHCAASCDKFDSDYVHILGNSKFDSDLCKIKKRLNLVSALQDEFRISTESIFFYFDWRNAEELTKYMTVKSRAGQLLYDLLVLKKVADNNTHIGISVSYEGQFLLSLLTAKILKQIKSDIVVLFGGSFFYSYFQECEHILSKFNYVDYLIIGPGETVIENIITNNLQELWNNKGIKITQMDALCCVDSTMQSNVPHIYKPNFDDISFNDYLSEESAFPYMIKNRCYYGLCNFCNGDKTSNQPVFKDIMCAFENIKSISHDIGVKNVYIVDAAISPSDLRKISNLEFHDDIRWIANARFEKDMVDENLWFNLKKSGCEMLRFGLESGSQKVLDLMRKGTNIDVVSEILLMSYNAGIKNHVYIMFGYPGETKEDRQETINFLFANKKFIYSYSISVFDPVPNTFTYNELSHKINSEVYLHQDLIDILYPTEDYFNDIVFDIVRLNETIGQDCRTNGEWGERNKDSGKFYSANVFANESCMADELVILGYMFVTSCKDKVASLTLPYNYELNEITKDNISSAMVVDIESNSMVKLNISCRWIKHLQEGFVGSIEEFVSKTNQPRDKVIELISVLSRRTNCVQTPNINLTCENKYFSIVECVSALQQSN